MKALRQLLRQPIAFHRVFVDITGSVNAALFLSQACYWASTKEWDWFYKTQQDWELETGLTRHEQDAVRRKLVKLNVLEEARKGVPATMHYRVDLDNLIAEIGKLDCRKVAICTDENQQTGLPESGKPYKEAETTSDTTQRKIERATRFPNDFEPSDGNVNLANALGLNLPRVIEAWRDFHKSKGSRFIDWHLALNTWLRNEKKWEKGNGNKGSKEQKILDVRADAKAILRRESGRDNTRGVDRGSPVDHVRSDGQGSSDRDGDSDYGDGSGRRIIRRTVAQGVVTPP